MVRLLIVLTAIAVSACVDSSTSSVTGPTKAVGTVEVTNLAAGTLAVNGVSRCSLADSFFPNLLLTVAARGRDVSVDQVTVQLGDGSNAGGASVTFSRPSLSAMFGSTLVRANNTRSFGFRPSFACGFLASRFLQATIIVIDDFGSSHTITTSAALR